MFTPLTRHNFPEGCRITRFDCVAIFLFILRSFECRMIFLLYFPILFLPHYLHYSLHSIFLLKSKKSCTSVSLNFDFLLEVAVLQNG
ncbi:unnamed protein product [Meloidogyne enterolobii]|uniref:Uncharacterized protein n=1 Tax=Meloidogyne enterolobii TaxID=390850 RepID=A0ACB0Y8B9_MELEN